MNNFFILESFWQDPKGYNCATVAIIKAAVMKYGIGRVFKTETRISYMIITLRNGKALIVTNEELKRINKENDFRFSRYSEYKKKKDLKRLKDYVCLCFAIMVKYLKEYGFNYEDYTIEEAIETLLAGFNTDYINELLGLAKMRNTVEELNKNNLELLKKKSVAILYSYAHVVVVCNGYFDDYGTPLIIGKKIPELGELRAKFWYQLK